MGTRNLNCKSLSCGKRYSKRQRGSVLTKTVWAFFPHSSFLLPLVCILYLSLFPSRADAPRL